MYKQIVGDIFESDAQYLVHQTNCVVVGKASGIAGIIFDKYKYADVYSHRENNSTPGTIEIRGNGIDQRFIVNLMSQYYPGYHNTSNDSSENRRKWFRSGLIELSKQKDLNSIVFPAGIGCDLAGGVWKYYNKFILDFYNHLKNVDVSIYCLPSNVNKFEFEEVNYD